MDDYNWTQEDMIISIKKNDQIVMKISVYEVIETAGYKNVMRHVDECNRTPWLRPWQTERMDAVFSKLVGITNDTSR